MLHIRKFDKSHMNYLMRLIEQVGWNHIEQDWLRLLDLNPEGCLGGFVSEELVATCSVASYGKFGWVGTFLVDEALRGKGYGKLMVKSMLNKAEQLGIEFLGLDSSDAGRPIYLKYGFTISSEGNERWTGPNGGMGDKDVQQLEEKHWDSLLMLDVKNVNNNRANQLRHLASEPGSSGCVLVENGEVVAFGFSRPGRLAGVIGPVVAQKTEYAVRIINALLVERRRIDGDGAIAVDLLDREKFKDSMTQLGFVMRRRNIRMYSSDNKLNFMNGSGVYVSTALGMG